jgi:hypothetical protein
MKKAILFSTLLILAIVGCRSKKVLVEAPPSSELMAHKTGTDFSLQETWLLGFFDFGRLSREPYSEWYLKGFDEYQPNPVAMSVLTELDKSGISVKVVMGTWCPDSRREVPRFMKILTLAEFPMQELTFIGVDNAKLSPVGEFDTLGIQRVPTFIIFRNKVESGRIIENPVASLEQDLLDILKRNEKQ